MGSDVPPHQGPVSLLPPVGLLFTPWRSLSPRGEGGEQGLGPPMGTCYHILAPPRASCVPSCALTEGHRAHMCRHPAAWAPSAEPAGRRGPAEPYGDPRVTHVVWQGARVQDPRCPCLFWLSVPSSANEPVHEMKPAASPLGHTGPQLGYNGGPDFQKQPLRPAGRADRAA